MDHTEAIRQQVAEKYILGELAAPLRDEYEEHYFDCSACALDVKTLSTFVDVSRAVLRGEAQVQEREAVAQRVEERTSGRWFAWLRPVWMVPALAAMILVIGYQNTVTIPHAKSNAGGALSAGQELPSYSLQMANVRGEEGVKVPVRAGESFILDFDFTPSKTVDSYTYQLQDEAGNVVFQRELAGEKTNKELHIVVPGGDVHSGAYSLVFFGGAGQRFHASGESEVARLRFKIEIQP
jgi:hypothetical protein